MHRFIGPTDARGMFDEMPSPEKLQPNPTRNPSNQARHAHQRTPPPVGIHPGGCRAGRAQGNGRARTCVLAVLVGAGLGEDLEVDEAEGHEPQGEPRHEPREEHQHHDDHHVLEEGRPAAVVLHRHPPPTPTPLPPYYSPSLPRSRRTTASSSSAASSSLLSRSPEPAAPRYLAARGSGRDAAWCALPERAGRGEILEEKRSRSGIEKRERRGDAWARRRGDGWPLPWVMMGGGSDMWAKW